MCKKTKKKKKLNPNGQLAQTTEQVYTPSALPSFWKRSMF
jgi:hypothetical protein